MLQQAQAYRRGRPAGNVTFRQASVMETGFDVAIARFLLQHVADPLGAVTEIARILKPGGRLIISDSDEDCFYLADPPFTAYQDVLEAFRRRRPSRPPRRKAAFLPLLKRAGLVGLNAEAIVAHSEEHAMQDLQTTLAPERLVDAAVQANLLTPAGAEQAMRDIAAFFRSDQSVFALILFMAWGEKPAS